MSYYANYDGKINLNNVGQDLNDLRAKYNEVFEGPTVYNVNGMIAIDVCGFDNYRDDLIEELLNSDKNIISGEIDFVGEDHEHWRWIKRGQKELWHEESGYVCYDATSEEVDQMKQYIQYLDSGKVPYVDFDYYRKNIWRKPV